jgi:T5SS/PEP-CTERM-associated repeat protein
MATTIALGSAGGASAGVCFWSGQGNDDLFSNPLNWFPDPVPVPGDSVAFIPANLTTVDFDFDPINVNLTIDGAGALFRSADDGLGMRHYTLTGTVDVRGDGLGLMGLDLTTSHWMVVDDDAELTVVPDPERNCPGSTLTVADLLTVGDESAATLLIEGGSVHSGGSVIGLAPGASGAVIVDHGTWNATTAGGDFAVGWHGAGAMVVTGNGMVSSTHAEMGVWSTAHGYAHVGGENALWANLGTLSVGVHGPASLEITDGGTVLSSYGYVGAGLAGDGVVTIEGPSSRWIQTGDLTVGYMSSGSVSLSDGAYASSVDGYIGRYASSAGALSVRDPRTRWTCGGDLSVGRAGDGLMVIANGATVENVDALLAAEPGGDGTVVVNGAGSMWSNAGSVFVGGWSRGAGGEALLEITQDGAVEIEGWMRIWCDGAVRLQSGWLRTDSIERTDHGLFHFTGGTLLLNTFDGDLINQGGTLRLGGVDPSTYWGRVVVLGDYVQGAGTLELAIHGDGPEEFEALEALDAAVLGGWLKVHLAPGFVPDHEDEFPIVLAGEGLDGVFANALAFVDVHGGGRFAVEYLYDANVPSVTLTGYVPSECPGDVNGDGAGGVIDLQTVIGAWGTCIDCPWDVDGSGDVGFADVLAILESWGPCP